MQLSRQETCSALTPGPGPGAGPAPPFPVVDWDRFEFVAFLGQGGMGKVFLARDRRLDREVAIKFVRIDDGRYLERFKTEARAQARVDHAHVCKVFEVGEVEGKVFITMQHIRGASLDEAATGLSLEQKVLVLRDAAMGVHAAHRVGIIHRDLKPGNIMVARAEDGALETFVMDFGLARDWSQKTTDTGSVLGTPAFMSPEQARGEVSGLDRRADVYSLGATLYQLLAGVPPVTGANALEVLSNLASAEIAPLRTHLAHCPRDLEAITLKCLEKDRSRRYGSAQALAEDLDRFLAGEPVQARPAGLLYRLQRRLRKHRQLAAVAGAALVAVLLALGSALRTRGQAAHRERLAQQFTEVMGRIEAQARYSALAPLHDIRPDLAGVRAEMAQLQADMSRAGTLANGPGHYALGRGHWTLDDGEKALEHLRMAWDAGFRTPRAAYALALVLIHSYQEQLLEAERIKDPGQREARKQRLAETLRQPALGFLRQAQGPGTPSPRYLAALMAFCEGRPEEALAGLKALGDETPWFFEANLLRGSLLQARAWQRWNRGDREGAQGDFQAGRAVLGAAAASGRSSPAVHAALGDLELNVLLMEKYGQGRVEAAYARGRAAVDTALAAQPDHVPSLILKAALLGNVAEYRMNHGETADGPVQEAVAAARAAMAAGPARADARAALGKAYYHWGNVRQDRNQDPTEQLARGLEALESLAPPKRDYSVENHLGLIHQTWADFEEQNGRDPGAHLGGAIAAYQRATRLEPAGLPALINLGTCLRQRAMQPGAPGREQDLGAALAVLEQARALNPGHYVACFVQGKVLCDLALLREARGEDPEPDLRRSLAANRQGLAINGGIPHLHNGAAVALGELARLAWETGGEPGPLLEQAKDACRRAIAVAPGQVFGYANLGDLLARQARWQGDPAPLAQALAQLDRGLRAAPGNRECLASRGRVQAVALELGRDADPGARLARGEADLDRALAVDRRDTGTWQCLAELRVAAAAWRASRQRAQAGDFDRAAQALSGALALAPDSPELQLGQARLHWLRARWERSQGRAPEASLSQGRTALEAVLRRRPHWAEALAVDGALRLEAAEAAPPAAQAEAAATAAQALTEALRRNGHLARDWQPLAERAQRLARR